MSECRKCGAQTMCKECPTRIACAAKMDADTCQSCPGCGGCRPRPDPRALTPAPWQVCRLCLFCEEVLIDEVPAV